MRATTLLNTVLGIKYTRVTGAEFTQDAGLRRRADDGDPRCERCGRQVRKVYDQRKPRLWRHLDLAGMSLELRYAPRRLRCPSWRDHRMVPWADPMSWFTHAFEQTVGYLAQESSKTVVSTMMRVAWATVGAIIGRVVERMLPDDSSLGSRTSARRAVVPGNHKYAVTSWTTRADVSWRA
jgi:transposase